MSTQSIDYDALAKQYGATSSIPAAIDYDALAKQHGAISSTPPDAAAMRAASVARNAQPTQFEKDSGIGSQMVKSYQALGQGVEDAAHGIQELPEQAGHAINKLVGVETPDNAPGSKPFLRRMGNALNPLPPDQGQGLDRRLLQAAGNVGTQAAMGKIAEGVAPEVATNLSKLRAESMERFKAARNGTQAAVVPEAAPLPPKAVSGAEDIFRAAAPTGMNQGFRANVYAAAGDLADIGKNIELKEAAGGIINPDMRVRATVDAIDTHLEKMYREERVPQIQRNAQTPVKTAFGPDAEDGLMYLSRRAGLAADRELAATALEEGKLSMVDADRLAQVVNKELKGFESMTPAERAAGVMTSRRLGALKQLDVNLGGELNSELTAAGEEGLRGYERRYAALSEIRDQLGKRMNAVELKQEGVPGAIGRVTRPIAKLVTGGKSGIASASQAAVADVNVGRRLQTGLRKLSESGLTAKKTSAAVAPQLPQAPNQ